MQMRNANIAAGMIIREKAAYSFHSFNAKQIIVPVLVLATCASSAVVGVSLQRPAHHQANQMDISNSC